MSRIPGFALLAMAAICGVGALSSPDRGQPRQCRPVDFEGDRFTVCRAVRGQQTLTLFGRDGLGQAYRQFAALPLDGRNVAFAMNAGMFDSTGKPIGLFVSDGRTQSPLNRKRASTGNFFLQPNGVFYGDSFGWHVSTSDAYAADPSRHPGFATQSGPMLVIANTVNPLFGSDGLSRYVRNGVGVDAKGDAWFAISAAPVSFGRFGRLFRDRLHTPDALYFDGYVSSLWDPATNRRDDRAELGPIVVALQKR
ncbi:hypothetical protein DBR17_10735 [Sphingomonas sp. HMWF008]|nr:hypothetical protein DBR17_10735 [Sphingomonas sp. HMWF008]